MGLVEILWQSLTDDLKRFWQSHHPQRALTCRQSVPPTGKNVYPGTDNHLLRVAVAFSGGKDSSALLHAASKLHQEHPAAFDGALHAIHVNHQLSPFANSWEVHCQTFAQQLGVQFHAVRVVVNHHNSLEQQARTARYQALIQLCKQWRIDVLLMAHHLDDQIETVFFRLMRGSGFNGLVGMPSLRWLNMPDKGCESATVLSRPWLTIEQQELVEYVRQHNIDFIDDESNEDHKFVRNYLRHCVLPAYYNAHIGVKRHVALSIQQMQQDQSCLDEYAAEDLSKWSWWHDSYGWVLNYENLRATSTARASTVIRYWLKVQCGMVPNRHQLDNLMRSVQTLAHDAQLEWHLGEWCIRNFKKGLYVVRHFEIDVDQLCTKSIQWFGNKTWSLPEFGGLLEFEWQLSTPIEQSPLWGRWLEMRFRQGGERMSMGVNRPSRPLKLLFQQGMVEPWNRKGPCLWVRCSESDVVKDTTETGLRSNAHEQLLWVYPLGWNAKMQSLWFGLSIRWKNCK